jgi:antirestriction protein ArdC
MPSVYEIITEKIIKQLESGVAPWRKPWTCQTPANLVTQKEYRGLNVFTLASQGFPSRFWLTFNQAMKLGGRIGKGEESSPVILWNVGDKREMNEQDAAKETSRPFLLRYYNVFNLSQTEGIEISASLLQETRTNDPIDTCEQIVTNMPSPPAFEQSDKAWYSSRNDVVGMPARGLFHSSEEYYATAFHELNPQHGAREALAPKEFRQPRFLWFGILLERGTHCGDGCRNALWYRGNRAEDS